MKWSLALITLAFAAPAFADPAECIKASDDGQKLRDEGHLMSAHAALAMCAHEECPSAIRSDCLRWLDEVDHRTPSVVISALSHGKETSDVRVVIDGVPAVSRLDGRPISVDPGEHHVRYEHSPDAPIEETVVARDGEKDRLLRVDFGPKIAGIVEPPRSPPTLGYVMTSVAIAGLAGFGIAAAGGYLLFTSCQSNVSACDSAGSKTSSQIDFAVADISLGLGIIAAGIAAWAFVHHASHPPRVSALFGPRGAGFALTF